MSDNVPVRFSDEQASAILARAIEIDARSPLTTTEDLRVIAAEIGISESALESALREQTTSVKARRIAAAERTASRIVGLGVPLGVLAGSQLGLGDALPLMGLTAVGFVASSGIAVYQSMTGSLRSFQLRNLAFWGAVLAGGLAALAVMGDGAGRMPLLMMAGWCVRNWVVSSILGSAAVIAVRRSRLAEGDDADTGLPGSTTPTVTARVASVASASSMR